MFKEYAQKLQQGEVLAGPTETVFGLFADATNLTAIESIYTLKGRDRAVPLQVLVNSLEMAEVVCAWNDTAQALAEVHWPGPLTLVLPRRDSAWVDTSVAQGRDTIGVRFPDHPVPLGLMDALQRPIVATSANVSGQASGIRHQDVAAVFPDITMIKGTAPTEGFASTVIDLTVEPYALLREGAISLEDIEAVLS